METSVLIKPNGEHIVGHERITPIVHVGTCCRLSRALVGDKCHGAAVVINRACVQRKTLALVQQSTQDHAEKRCDTYILITIRRRDIQYLFPSPYEKISDAPPEQDIIL